MLYKKKAAKRSCLFKKTIKLTYNNKTLFAFLFIASILVFKTALSRSDTPHIKVAVGFNLFLIYSTGLYFLFSYIENKKKIKILINNFKKNNINLFIIFSLLIISILKTNITDIKNIPNAFNVKVAVVTNHKSIDFFFKYFDPLSK